MELYQGELPKDIAQRIELFDQLANAEPDGMREWVQRHPRNLMLYAGLNVEPFVDAGLRDCLDYQRTFWLAPRGSGKTTAYLFYSAWLGMSPPDVYVKAGIPYLFEGSPREIGPHNIRVALTTNSSDNAALGLYQVKCVFTDPRIERLFGKPLEGKRWKDQRADTVFRNVNIRETTYTALGLGSRITGGHYDAVLVDDWVTEENARTELQRSRLSSFWSMTVKPTHEPWARTFGAGTRYHPQDWYGASVYPWVQKGIWNHLRRTPALYTRNGKECSYWPGVFPVDILYSIREEIGEIAFATQYQNVVDVMLGDFFEHSWLEQFVNWDELPEDERANAHTVIALDPAIKAGTRNDYSVFVVLSVIGKKAYVRRVVRGQWTDEQLKVRAVKLCQQYEPETLGIEVVAAMEWLADSMAKLDLGNTRVRKLSPRASKGKDKVGRASHVRKWFEQLRVFLEVPTKANGIQRLVYECMAFPTASNTPGMDDCVDALVWALYLTGRARGRIGRQIRSNRT